MQLNKVWITSGGTDLCATDTTISGGDMATLSFNWNTLTTANATTNGTYATQAWTPITLPKHQIWARAAQAAGVEPPERVAYGPIKLISAERYELPDGSKLVIDQAGNYQIEDKDAKVTYRANRFREFSPHLNASDMLARFVEYVRTLGVRQSEVLGLPLELFVNWLIIEAAERDQDPVPAEVVRVEHSPAIRAARSPRCLGCGRFIPRLYGEKRFPFCTPEHGVRHLERVRRRISA